ncbi:type II secretion system inner membrane protein GspF [Craterilacuibacter sp.]|uniref:type II secretion system inner membrane protein GspF n=1 Tax=Craterilacuibacter sp. TaxID=2870909 RepID=UPI003F40B707
MAAFRYLALSDKGAEEKGVIEADSARSARALLRERGLTLLEIAAEGGKSGIQPRSLPNAELALFTQQLSTLLLAGLPLEKALLAAAEQSENPRTRSVVSVLRSEIMEGQSLGQALAKLPAVFGPLYISLVKAGEQSGHLDTVMARLSDYLVKRQALQQKVTLALAYPAVVTVVAMLVVVGLMTYVVPQVVTVFAQTKQTLPLLTRMLVASSDFLRSWGWALGLGAALAGYGFWRALQNSSFKRMVHVRLLGMPVIGRMLRSINTARMASTLAILAGSGVPLLNALETAKGLVGLLPMQEALTEATARVREGVPLSRALAARRQFPPVLIHLIASGEASGTLAPMLERAAEQQQQEVERRVATFTTLMEPLLILLMGGIVLVIVLAIMLPIIDMNQMVR